jgi:hypothetical protein
MKQKKTKYLRQSDKNGSKVWKHPVTLFCSKVWLSNDWFIPPATTHMK